MGLMSESSITQGSIKIYEYFKPLFLRQQHVRTYICAFVQWISETRPSIVHVVLLLADNQADWQLVFSIYPIMEVRISLLP
jgi:hypothetical protein